MARAGSPSLAARKRREAWFYLAPTLVVLAAVAGWPLLRTVWFSLSDAYLGRAGEATFIGLDNYLLLAGDGEWWSSVWNTLVFAACSVTLETVLGMGVALVLNARFPGRGLVRAAVLVPWAIPLVVSAKMWAWMFNDLYGVINAGLAGLGLIDGPVAWLADPNLAMAVVIMTDVWKTTPFMAILILAGLQMIPDDIYEAARIDGVHPLRVFFRITLPLVWPVLLVAVIFRTLDALRVFDLIYVMTSNSRDTASMSVFARQQMVNFGDLGYGSAASVLIVLIVGLATVLWLMAGRVRMGSGGG